MQILAEGPRIFRFPKVKTSTSIWFLYRLSGRFAGILASISVDETPPSLSSARGKQIDKRRQTSDGLDQISTGIFNQANSFLKLQPYFNNVHN